MAFSCTPLTLCNIRRPRKLVKMLLYRACLPQYCGTFGYYYGVAQEEEDFDGGMVKATVVLLASKAQLGLLLPLQLLQ